MQTGLMLVMAFTCLVSALDWIEKSQYASALAFVGFAVGYIGLSVIFRSTP